MDRGSHLPVSVREGPAPAFRPGCRDASARAFASSNVRALPPAGNITAMIVRLDGPTVRWTGTRPSPTATSLSHEGQSMASSSALFVAAVAASSSDRIDSASKVAHARPW